jgi:hypothetical protein
MRTSIGLMILIALSILSISPYGAAQTTGTLYIDSIRFDHTPQSGDWQFCFKLYDTYGRDGPSITIHPDRDWEGDPSIFYASDWKDDPNVEVMMDEIPLGSRLDFDLGLDDDYSDAAFSPEDFTTGRLLVAKKKGQQSYLQGEDGDWNYIIKYHWVKDV